MMRIWAFIIIAGVITYGIRLTFIIAYERIALPFWFRNGLRFVPAAVLSAILIPDLTTWHGKMDLSFQNPQILAGAIAILIAWRTRNVVLTLISGGAGFLLLNYLIR